MGGTADGFRVCSSESGGFRIRLLDDGLDNLLLVGVENLGQALVELWLLLLKVCDGVYRLAVGFEIAYSGGLG